MNTFRILCSRLSRRPHRGRAYAPPDTALERHRRSRVVPLLALLAWIGPLLAPLVPRTAEADISPVASSSASGTGGQVGLASPEGAPSSAAGSLAKATVDPSTGAFRVAIDFELPRARGAVQPALGLQYSSAGTYGVAGLGWSLTIPSIQRHNPSGPPLFQNDPAPGAPVNPTQQDHFTFGGEPLVEICYIGAGGSCAGTNLGHIEPLPSFTSTGGWHYYRLQTETGSLKRFFWSSDHLTWVVQDRDGTWSEYGRTLDQSLVSTDNDANGYVFRWNLSRRYDSQRLAPTIPANPILFVWKPLTAPTGNTLQYLTDIYDTSHPGDQSPTTDSFAHHTHLVYGTAQPALGASPIAPVWLALPTFLLERADITSQDYAATAARQQVRRYYLSYNNVGATAPPQPALQQIQMEGNCVGAGNQSTIVFTANNFEVDGQLLDPSIATNTCQKRPPTTFTYNASSVTSATVAGAIGTMMPSLSGSATRPVIFDINNDGLPDVLDTQAIPAIAWINGVVTPTGTSTFSSDTFLAEPLSLGASALDLSNINQIGSASQSFTGTFQADGRIDMLWEGAGSQITVSNSNTCTDPANPGAVFYCDSSVPYALLNVSSTGGTSGGPGSSWTLTPSVANTPMALQTRFPDFNATESSSTISADCQPPANTGSYFLGEWANHNNIIGGETPVASLDMNGDGLADSLNVITWGYLETQQIWNPFESTAYCLWPWAQYTVRFSSRDFTDQYYPFEGLPYSAGAPTATASRTDVCIGNGPTYTAWTLEANQGGNPVEDGGYTWGTNNSVISNPIVMSTMTSETIPADLDGDGILDLVAFQKLAQ
jgi:Salmonella virulence plasmid 65kDa B protein